MGRRAEGAGAASTARLWLRWTSKNAAQILQFSDVSEIEAWIKSQFDAISGRSLGSEGLYRVCGHIRALNYNMAYLD